MRYESFEKRLLSALEMDDDDARKAIEGLDGSDFGGRPLRINEAQERQDRRR